MPPPERRIGRGALGGLPIAQVGAKAAGVVSLESIQAMLAEIYSIAGVSHIETTANDAALDAAEATAWLIGKQREGDKTLAELVGKGLGG